MAFGSVAPWILPTDPLRSAQAGAGAGLTIRSQDLSQEEAADRLRFAYTQLQKEEDQRAEEAKARDDLANAAMQLRASQSQDLMRHRAALEQVQQQRADDLTQYRNSALQQAAVNAGLKNRNIHFGPNGAIFKVNDDNTVDTLRTADQKAPATHEPTFSAPLDPNNPLGPKLSGPLSDPEIKKRFDAASAAATTTTGVAPTRFNLMHPSTWFGSSASSQTPAAAPAAAPASTHGGSPYSEGTLLREKSDPNAIYKVLNGVPVKVPDGEDPNTWGGSYK